MADDLNFDESESDNEGEVNNIVQHVVANVQAILQQPALDERSLGLNLSDQMIKKAKECHSNVSNIILCKMGTRKDDKKEEIPEKKEEIPEKKEEIPEKERGVTLKKIQEKCLALSQKTVFTVDEILYLQNVEKAIFESIVLKSYKNEEIINDQLKVYVERMWDEGCHEKKIRNYIMLNIQKIYTCMKVNDVMRLCDNLFLEWTNGKAVVIRLTKKQISKIPIKTIEDTKDLCSICQSLAKGVVRSLKCNHIFHKECIDKWFKRSVHCPNCKKDMRE
jgi:hypothetical protein